MAINEFKEPTGVSTATTTAFTQPNASNPSMMAMSGSWSGGPFSAGVGYERHTGFRGAGTAGTQAAFAAAGTTTATFADRAAKDIGWQFGGKYNYGQGNIGLGYETLKYGNAGIAGADNSFKTKTWVIQADYNVSAAGRAYAGYAKNNGRQSCGSAFTVGSTTASTLANCGSELGAKQYSMGYDHSLSKRTIVYAYYANLKNERAGTFAYPSDSRTTNALNATTGTAGATSSITGGVSQSSINLGMKHTF